MTTIALNLQRVRERIAGACAAAQRHVNEVTLLPVSKTFGADAVREAHAAGATAFGENYIQEAVDKKALLADHMGLDRKALDALVFPESAAVKPLSGLV